MNTRARPLGLWMLIALVVGNMIGSGVFLLPAALAPYGAASLLGWGSARCATACGPCSAPGTESLLWGGVLVCAGLPIFLWQRYVAQPRPPAVS